MTASQGLEDPQKKKVAVIGAGVAGCAVAGALMDYGIDDFVVFDSNSKPGGLWAENYPGATGKYRTRGKYE